jgi:hypothetical protein
MAALAELLNAFACTGIGDLALRLERPTANDLARVLEVLSAGAGARIGAAQWRVWGPRADHAAAAAEALTRAFSD